MKGFCGHLSVDGRLTFSGKPAALPPEKHVGCQVFVHGYIANRTELRRRIGLDESRPANDSHLLASAFRTWGRELQRHVLGEYAAVIYDPSARTAILTHDALGV